MVKRAEDSATEHADSTLNSKLKLWLTRKDQIVPVDEINKDDYVHENKQTWSTKQTK